MLEQGPLHKPFQKCGLGPESDIELCSYRQRKPTYGWKDWERKRWWKRCEMMNLDQRWEKGSKWYQSSAASSLGRGEADFSWKCFYITKKSYCRKPVEQFLKAVDELQLKDITEFTSKMISKPLKMGCFGEHLSLFLNTFNILFFTYRGIKKRQWSCVFLILCLVLLFGSVVCSNLRHRKQQVLLKQQTFARKIKNVLRLVK